VPAAVWLAGTQEAALISPLARQAPAGFLFLWAEAYYGARATGENFSGDCEDMELDFEKENGLIPAIVQDAANGEVLMLGFMNREALAKTQETGFVTFWSRSRKKLWMKGETSGQRLVLREMRVDCDRDALLVRAELDGGAVCHEGYRSCFFRQMDRAGETKVVAERVISPQELYGGAKKS
jgi:phosphoribosyl-AMP cyclohydrolase